MSLTQESPDRSAAPPASEVPVVALTGIRLHALTSSEAVGRICASASSSVGGWVITPNLDILRRSTRDAEFRAFCWDADLVVADGMPLVWASWLQGTPLPGRVAGSSLIWTLSAAAAEQGRSIFLLGGEPGTAQAAARALRERNPTLKVAGTYCPPLGFEKDPAEMQFIRLALLAADPDIIFVALGSPKQERLIAKLREELPRAWWLGVGISFSFVCGQVKRAPVWVQRVGLEWVHRLIQEPRRLFRRYIIEDLPFAAVLFAGAIANRFRRAAGDPGHPAPAKGPDTL